MKQNTKIKMQPQESSTQSQALARTTTSPECLSAAVLTICHKLQHSDASELVTELKQQSAAIQADDLSRAESMLIAQAHTLDGLFARLATNALSSQNIERMDLYMRLGLRAQNQSRATLQTLIELRAPRQIAFVKQANIGNQVQVNNRANPARARAGKNQNEPNELLEAKHGERVDTRASSSTSRTHKEVETVGKKYRTSK